MEISRYWRLQHQRYGLVGIECGQCGHKMFPPRDICPKCTTSPLEPYDFPRSIPAGKSPVVIFDAEVITNPNGKTAKPTRVPSEIKV